MASEEHAAGAATKTLRDEFAIAALTGIMAAEDYGPPQNYFVTVAGYDHAAARAYCLADAMLKARGQ